MCRKMKVGAGRSTTVHLTKTTGPDNLYRESDDPGLGRRGAV